MVRDRRTFLLQRSAAQQKSFLRRSVLMVCDRAETSSNEEMHSRIDFKRRTVLKSFMQSSSRRSADEVRERTNGT